MKSRLVIATVFCLVIYQFLAAERVVILPERFANSPVVVQNSPAYKALVEKNAKLTEQLAQEKDDQSEFERATDIEIMTKEAKLERLEAENAKLKSKSRFNFFGFINLVMSFVANPFAFIMQRLLQIVLVLVVILGSIVGVKVILNRRRKKNP